MMIDMGQAKGILFDVDGTLMDNNGDHLRAWYEAFAHEGHPVTKEAVAMQLGKGSDTLVATLGADLDEPTRERVRLHHHALYLQRIDDVQPFPGATEALLEAKRLGLKVALASSAHRDELDVYRGKLMATELVDAVVSHDDVRTSKPAPDIFLAALGKLSLSASEALVVGDTPYDVQAARAAGIACVSVLSGGFPREVLAAEHPRAICTDVREVALRLRELIELASFPAS